MEKEALYSQQKQDQELTVTQIMNSLLKNSDLNWRNLKLSKFGNLENSAGTTGLEKVFTFQSQRKTMPKEHSNYCTIAFISHTSKGMLKILQARLQQYMNCELSDVQAGFRKGRGTRDQIANIRRIIEKARQFQKNICFCFSDYAKAFDCVDHNKLWKIL